MAIDVQQHRLNPIYYEGPVTGRVFQRTRKEERRFLRTAAQQIEYQSRVTTVEAVLQELTLIPCKGKIDLRAIPDRFRMEGGIAVFDNYSFTMACQQIRNLYQSMRYLCRESSGRFEIIMKFEIGTRAIKIIRTGQTLPFESLDTEPPEKLSKLEVVYA